MQIELATEADEPELRRLLRDNPMAGAIRVALEREPDARLAAALGGDAHVTLVARRPDGSLRGMASRSVAAAFVNGQSCRLGYLSQLRLDRAPGRPAGLRRLLAAGFDRLRAGRGAGEAPFDLTTVVADNLAARRLLAAGLPGLPAYLELGAFVTLVLRVPTRPPRPLAGRPARPAAAVRLARGTPERMADVAACLDRNHRRYQLAPAVTEPQLLSPTRSRGLHPGDFHLALDAAGRLVGCLALWDQTAFKQAVVRGYGRRLRLLRPALNRLAPLLGTPRLPDPGEPLPHAYLAHLAVDGDDPQVFAALLGAARAAAAGRFLYLVAGFGERHPLLAPLRRRAREYRSILYAVCGDAAGKAAVAALDGRPPHLEAALL